MNKHTKICTAAVGLAITLTLTLAGCVGAPTTHNTGAPKPSTSHSATTAPAPTGKPGVNVGELKAGDSIDASTAADINNGDDTSIHAYKLSNGSYAVVKTNEPLPAAVQADAQAKANTVPKITATDVTSQDSRIAKALSMSGSLSYNTGKQVVVITYGVFSTPTAGPFNAWAAYGTLDPVNNPGGPVFSTTSAADAAAKAAAYIAAQPDAANWTIVVAQ